MKTITLENGKTVEISDESYSELCKAVEPDPLTYWDGEKIYLPDELGVKDSVRAFHGNNKLRPFRFVSEKSYDRFEKLIQLQNYADRVNGEFGDMTWTIWSDSDTLSHSSDIEMCGEVRFSSQELAKKAVEYFGEDFFEDL